MHAITGPKRLADVIASASGLARWAAESAKASAEVERTRRALQDIDTNVDRLVCVQHMGGVSLWFELLCSF